MNFGFDVKVTALGSWIEAANLARQTVHLAPIDHEPSDRMKRELLDAEHSPIRAVRFKVELKGIPYWVSVHLVRHKFGVEHFVSTQRTDRTGIDRDGLPQSAPVDHTMIVDAQEMMFISRRRLCSKASPETRAVWKKVVECLSHVDPILAEFCVPMCIYRGGYCHEANGCGFCTRQMLGA